LQDLNHIDDVETQDNSLHDSIEKDCSGTELSWMTSLDIYELLDANGLETIGFREFCALINLVAGVQSNQLLQCLYQHGILLFDIIGGG
jgi:hypothetical protein